MKTNIKLGDLVVAAYDEALRETADPGRATVLASAIVRRVLERSRRRALERHRAPAPRALIM
jgi:hypothetical protein